MFRLRSVCLYALVALWLLDVSTAFDHSEGDVHQRHRALQCRRLEGRLMRRISARRRQAEIVEKRNPKPDPGFDAGNIHDMTKFVDELKKMNEDWQKEATSSLEKGQTPKAEESTAELLSKIDKEMDDQSDTYGYTAPKSLKTKPTDSDSYGKDGDDDDDETVFSSVQDEAPPKKPSTPKPKKVTQTLPAPKKVEQARPPPKKESPPPKQSPKKEDDKKKDDDDKDSYGEENPKKKTTNKDALTKGSGGNGGGGTFHGDMTFFSTGLNACGWTDTDDQFIVAASEKLWNTFGHMSNGNPICGRRVRIHHNGKTVEARVTDQCPPCDMYSLDMSPSLFAHLENPDTGRCGVEWEWV